MPRLSAHPLPPPIVQRRFAFTKNLYRQLTCVSLVRLVLGVISIVLAILETILKSRYHETWHLAASGALYILASCLALLGCSYASITRYRLLWSHSVISILACLLVYPGEVGVLSLELCHDTAWCLCVVKPRRSCPPNWTVVPVELAALFLTTIAFVLNLLAAVVSRKTWKAASARRERMRSSSCRRTLKRAKREADECLATNSHQQKIQSTGNRCNVESIRTRRWSRSMDERDLRFLFVGAAAATAASAAAAPMFSESKTVVEHLNRPQTLLYPKNVESDEQLSIQNARHLYWWKCPENFV